jgi:UDPglucose 6-dehydrogenase
MRICVSGAGYVGLVSAAGFASLGNDVICADVDEARVAALRGGALPIYEPGLEELVRRGVAGHRLAFTTDVAGAIARSELAFVAVGTPPRGDGGADLSSVFAVAELVAQNAAEEMILVLKSTVPVGTNGRVRRIVQGAEQVIHVVSNPEFLKEGDAVQDFLWPDRVIVGADPEDLFVRRKMSELYQPLHLDRDRMLFMDPASAELTKYVANSMLAMRVSFMNEIAALCEAVGADAHMVRYGVGSDARIGPKFLYAGPGFGGSCFPKDLQALIETGREHGLELELACATHRVNQRQKGALLRKLRRHFDHDLRRRRVGIWGLAFKPRTDDIRESPALTLIDALLTEGAEIVAHDPEARGAAAARYGDRIRLVGDAYEAADGSEALVLVTEWPEYRSPDFQRLRRIMRRPLLLDGRNVWSRYGCRGLGFVYEGIGVGGRG